MIIQILDDEYGIPEIKQFVRANADIEFSEYCQKGCNGEVYFGKRIKMGDDVVLKFYHSSSVYDASEEAVILRDINHTNILKIWDLKFLPPYYAYFLTPRISGGDLQSIIDNGILSTKKSLKLVSGILIGLNELHSKHNLVHRDLKPSNILFDIEEEKPIIADLGSVKKIEQANGCVTPSKCTNLFLPPESIISKEYYYRSDIYQVGIIMFQLLGGFFPIHTPFDWLKTNEKKQLDQIANSLQKELKLYEIIFQKIKKGQIADTNKLPYYLDAEFKRVLNKALNIDYNKRYPNASFFLTDIHNLLRQYPDYSEESDRLLVKHENGKEFQLYQRNNSVILEKRIGNNAWRNDNRHNGTKESALYFARKP